MNPAQAPVVGSGSPRALGSGAGEPRFLMQEFIASTLRDRVPASACLTLTASGGVVQTGAKAGWGAGAGNVQ